MASECLTSSVVPITSSTLQYSVAQLINAVVESMEKGCHKYLVYGCKAMRGSPQVRLRYYFTLGRRSCRSVVGKLASSAGTPTCCRLISSTVSWVTWGMWCLSTGGGLQCPGSFAYGDSMEAQAPLKALWKSNQTLWIYSQISFVFPSFTGKNEIVVPRS